MKHAVSWNREEEEKEEEMYPGPSTNLQEISYRSPPQNIVVYLLIGGGGPPYRC